MATNQKTLPIDGISKAKLAAGGLRLDLVDTSDEETFAAWLQATTRGFHGGQASDELVAAMAKSVAYRRSVGVWDDTASDPESAVGTVDGFESPVTVPGGRDLPAWAISMVTVAPTHRRRGIARELLESELRTAVALGLPMAMLTVSESTIYQRFGFEPAAMASDLTISTQRAKFIGAVPDGRVQFVDIEQARAQVDALYATARLASPGEMEVWPRRWDQIFGIADEKDVSKRPRAARYDDVDGTTQGIVVYRMKENSHDFTGHTAQVEYLIANTPDAYAALWRFLLELDLTSTVTASLRPIDEPLRWLVNDFRAVKVETYDHLWLRILDVPAALNAREFYAPLDLVIEVTDNLGHASGRYHLGSVVEPVETTPETTSALTLSVNELSAIYLGGVSATTLFKAGRIAEHQAGSVAQLDAAFTSPVTPWLSVWF
jgi:predicted acetyltransferase